MRSTRLVVLTLALGIVPTAHAAVFSTPILPAPAGNSLACIVSNVGLKPAKFTVTLLDDLGNPSPVLADTCADLFPTGELPAGRSCAASVAGPSNARCTVNASGKIRAHLAIIDATANVTVTVAATK